MVGALLGQAGLKRLSGQAMGTLVIAANIPDIDAVATLFGTESLAMRRGLTHGPIAMVLLPLALTALVLLWNRWRPSEQPVRPKALLLLAYIGTLSHPALDWLNSYGVRLLEPFSSRSFAGDTLFIIDVWIWAALIVSFLWSRRREKREGQWTRPAWLGLAAIVAYIAANWLVTSYAERRARVELESRNLEPRLVVANPQPLAFWRRTILWRSASQYGSMPFAIADGLRFDGRTGAVDLDHPALAASLGRSDVRAYLFWSRMPVVVQRDGQAYLADQRFMSRWTRGQFVVPLDSPTKPPNGE